jgi:23S rRNA pseudouridine2605 synthase
MAASRYPRGHVALERALSKLGLASRREAQQLIRDGIVTVNGRVTGDPLAPVRPERDAIVVAGRAAHTPVWRTLALHKPRGYITTRRDPQGRPTVFELLGHDGDGLVAVGRLDLATTGLLLLTTDTQLAERLTNPGNAVVRRYVVTVRNEISDEDCRRLEQGIGGLHAASVEVRKRSRRETHLIVELTEGKNREIRRLFAGVGHEVTRLLRVAYGPIDLGTLQPGRWREISAAEFSRL